MRRFTSNLATMHTAEDTPYVRFRHLTPGALGFVDLVALGVASSESEKDQAEAYEAVRRRATLTSQFHRVADLSEHELAQFGVESYEAVRALAWIEIGRRMERATRSGDPVITGPADAAEFLRSKLRLEKKEQFVVVLLDAKGQVMHHSVVHIGTLTMSVVGPREVFREAIRAGAASIIVAHNHPSGNPDPSPEDIEITERLVRVGEMLDIPVNDHIIIGYDTHISLRERGLMG
ncbi:MAG: DNA repair protein RadC [Fimbriimonadaceae bacterium]|nr:hypothetical protein [Fimbriimonadaceae bacterium]MCL4284823.1 DNA repair protein RadC [Fimbriimonadaceae bacterium]QOJ12593.1 MAG: DNA repair protein RadC [Chthonomonadaceae bacterium]